VGNLLVERCMLVRLQMRPLPSEKPRSRLLESITGPAWPVPNEPTVAQSGSPVRRRPLLRFFYRSVAAVLMLSGIVFWCTRRSAVRDEAVAIRKLIAVGTRMLSSAAHPTMPPSPIVVQLSTDLVQVTSIALGHPRLAVINGKQVAEGDTITVHTPARSVAITLRVLEISDRQVKLSDGTQLVTAHLMKPEKK
jgi:hypothetical protein